MLKPNDTNLRDHRYNSTTHPQGKFKQPSGARAFPVDVLNDIYGALQSVLSQASVTPSGLPDEVGTSDFLTALTVLVAAETSGSTTIIVETADDFPTPSSDVITLADDTVYLLTTAINVGNDRFILGDNTVIRGISSLVSSITTTNTGNIFTGTQVNFHFDNWKLTATSGTVFDLTGGAYESAWLKDWTVNSCSSMGEVDDYYSFFWGSGAVVSCTTGLNFVSTTSHSSICIFDLVEFITGYTWALDFETDSPTFDTLTFNRCGFSYASATNHIKVLASNGNVKANGTGRITQCKFNVSVASASRVKNLTAGDTQWLSYNNSGLSDTVKDAHMYMHTAAQTTTITTSSGDSGNPILVDCSTNYVQQSANEFTVSTSGRMTCTAISPSEYEVTFNITGTSATGSNKFYNFYVYHYDASASSGSIITGSRTRREFASGTLGNVTGFCNVQLDTNDWIEIHVENTTDETNWVSDSLNVKIGAA